MYNHFYIVIVSKKLEYATDVLITWNNNICTCFYRKRKWYISHSISYKFRYIELLTFEVLNYVYEYKILCFYLNVIYECYLWMFLNVIFIRLSPFEIQKIQGKCNWLIFYYNEMKE